jgi:signal transduction histidine kinase
MGLEESPVFAISTVVLAYENDVVLARRRAGALARHLGFDHQQQVRFATAVSELARNAFQYGTKGRVSFSIEREGERSLLVARVRDEGPGIAELERVLAGSYVSRTGMGKGLVGARRLSDRFAIESAPGRGTTVSIAKVIAHAPIPLTAADLSRVTDALVREDSGSAFDEMQRQNQELLSALEQLERSNTELDRLNQELAETNRGVVALYTELDDRAAQLRLLSETKTRFLSDVSHELRTPLSSIVNLSRILLAGTDGPLSREQEHQVSLVQRSAESLTEMVSDLLDVAKIEAGRVELRPDDFDVAALFAALRGMFRPLVTNERVALVFDEPAGPIELYTDEQRIGQVLRNFVSNALKFTVEGEVRVSASIVDDMVRFVVADTGIGIAPADQHRIFQDYVQVDGPIQRRVRGTGLGLPLTAKLAAVLGGRVEVESELGVGSRFSLIIPCDVRAITADGGDHG